MRLKLILTALYTLIVFELHATVSPGGRPIGVVHQANNPHPYVVIILGELGILLVLAVLILIKVRKIRRSRLDVQN